MQQAAVITWFSITVTGAEYKQGLKPTEDIPWLTISGELWDVICKDTGEWPCYNGTTLYMHMCEKFCPDKVNMM